MKQYLRRLVTGHRGCLGAVPEDQTRVLVLRTGLGIRRAYDRGRVARMLHLSLRREGRLEQKAVSGIQAAAKRGCPTISKSAARGFLAAAGAASDIERLLFGTGTGTSSLAAARQPSRKTGQGPNKQRHAVAGARTHISQGAMIPPPHSGSDALLWILLAAGMFAATAVAAPLARRGLGTAPARRRLAPGAPHALEAGEAAPTAALPEAAHEAAAPAAPSAAAGAAAAGAAAGAAATAGAGAAQREREGDVGDALAAYRRADAAGHPQRATNLGILLEQQGDLEGALAAYRRADERGDVNGSFNLGCLLTELGDLPGAIAALRRTDQRGDPTGASNLGVLLEQQGDFEGALAAYRRADERGDVNGSFNLGLLLAGRGELAGARTAYQRAAKGGDPKLAELARSALLDLDKHAAP
jgi:TPR repeat protein